MTLIKDGEFPFENISYLLFLDVVQFFSPKYLFDALFGDGQKDTTQLFHGKHGGVVAF